MPSATLVIVAQPIEQVLGEVSGLTVVYGATTALGGVDLQIRAGEFVAIMGRSGSGKSTLLHCLAGLQTPTSGEVFLVGQALTGLGRTALAKHRRAATALVFQSYNLVPFLSVVDNVALPGAISGHGWNRTAALAALGDVGLTDLARSKPALLSGGEQQRVAIARALAGDQPLILADEPTGALDTANGHAVLDLLRAVPAAGSRAVAMVTHDPMAASYADRVVILRDGLVVGEVIGGGTAEIAAVLAQPGSAA